MSALLAPGFADVDLVPVGDWHPTRCTPTLTGTDDYTTDADRLLAVVGRYWRSAEVERFLLDPWQVWLLRRVLETYPDDWPVPHLRGQLRYRQVVISLARQNGKSVLGALLAFYFLTMHVRGPRVVGLASVDRQARIVYDRVRYAVENQPAFARELKATGTRGITLRNGSGIYQTLPAKEESAQGEPVTGGIYDELHLGLSALWDALVLGQRARRNSMLVGITTAGDADSDLLIRLYSEGQAALDGDDERFGFFVWEAAGDELTEANLIAANPAVACGRIPLDTALADARKMWNAPKDDKGVPGRDRVIRYTLNRFLEGSSTAWASLAAWNAGADPAGITHDGTVVYGIDRTLEHDWATITATSHRDGLIATEVVATIAQPTLERLAAACRALAGRGPSAFALDPAVLGDLVKALKDDGFEVWALNAAEKQAAAATARAAIARRTIRHPGDPLTRLQMNHAKRRDTPEGWRISRTYSTGPVDAVLATVWALYVATTRTETGVQLF